MKVKIERIQCLLLSSVLLFSGLLVSCQSDSIRAVRWQNLDLTIQDLKIYKPELIKVTPTTPEEKVKNSFEEITAYQLPDGNYYYLYMNPEELLDIYRSKPGEYWMDRIGNDEFDYFQRDSDNPYLNPRTLIHPDQKKEADKFPLDLFINQNKETISVTKNKDIYTVLQNKQEIGKGKILAFTNPWIVLTDGVKDRSTKQWQYTLVNTNTNKTYSVTVQGKIDSVKNLLRGLLFEVTDQSFFKSSIWLFTPEKNSMEKIGSEHVKAVTVGDTSWIVFWDWYDNMAKIYRYDTGKVVESIDFGKYMVRSILPYQDQQKNWNLWIIPTLTYEKFTSNVFWMPITTRNTTITNMDFHKELFVSKALIDSTDRLLLFVHDKKKETWTAGNLNSFLCISPQRTKAYNLPIDRNINGAIENVHDYKVDENSIDDNRIKNDLHLFIERNEHSIVPITSKINLYSKLSQKNVKMIEDLIKKYFIIFTPIKDGKVSKTNDTITWDMKVTYKAKYEYKIPILSLFPKVEDKK